MTPPAARRHHNAAKSAAALPGGNHGVMPFHELINRAEHPAVALETTLLAHGVPPSAAPGLNDRLNDAVRSSGSHPALVGVVAGRPTVGMTDEELSMMLGRDAVPKLNRANLGTALRPVGAGWGATTVSATMELAAAAGVRVFATGGLGGVHRGIAQRLDISSDLGAFVSFPVAVVASGVKSILDVESTREILESLAVPVVGFQTDRFPAFYTRESEAGVDARFDEIEPLAAFAAAEMARTGRGIVVCNPVPLAHELPPDDWARWLQEAEAEARGASGRDATPALLSALHRLSGGRTLESNIELVVSNATLAGRLAAAMAATPTR